MNVKVADAWVTIPEISLEREDEDAAIQNEQRMATGILDSVDAFFGSIRDAMYGKEEQEDEGMKIEVGKVYKTDEPLTGLPKDYTVKVLGEEDKHGWFAIKGLDSKDGCIIHKELFRKTFKPCVDEEPTKPAHYDTAIDTIAFAKANFPPEQVEGFFRINVIKYVQRYPKKNGADDIRKAIVYLNELLRHVEGEEE